MARIPVISKFGPVCGKYPLQTQIVSESLARVLEIFGGPITMFLTLSAHHITQIAHTQSKKSLGGQVPYIL